MSGERARIKQRGDEAMRPRFAHQGELRPADSVVST
jgi:hypothetical protein